MRLRLIVNPNATGVSPAVIDAVVTRLTAVCDLEIAHTERAGHAGELAADVAAGAVVAMGGDGTANEVVNGARAGVTLGVIPAGASSVFARQLGFPVDPVDATAVLARAIAAGSTRSVGLGTLDGRRFTFAASIGFDAAATRDIDEARRLRPGNVRPGDVRVLAAAIRELAVQGYALPERMTLERPGQPPIRASYIAVANQHPYTFFGRVPVLVTPRAGFDTGLDVVATRELRTRDLWRLPLYALVWPRHASGSTSGIAYLHDLSEFTVVCDVPTPVQLDGEFVGDHERADFGYVEHAVDIFVPAEGAPPGNGRTGSDSQYHHRHA